MDKKFISIDKLLVNPNNPRFSAVDGQQEAIDSMLAKEGNSVIALAKHIAEHGMNPLKNLLVKKENNDQFLTLEGNRRVTALKLLHNPQLTHDKGIKEQFLQISKKYNSNIPHQVECVIDSKEKDGLEWVEIEHNGKSGGIGVVNWGPTEKSRFLKTYRGKKPSRSHQLFDFSQHGNLNYEKVKASTLDRLTGNPYVRKQIGIKFPNKLLDLEKSPAEVLINLRKVFAEMSKTTFKVRQVYDKDLSKEWINKILGAPQKNNKQKQETPTPKSTDNRNDSSGTKDDFYGSWINHKLFSFYPKNDRVKAILKELKTLDPYTKPNICGTSFRVLLELSLYLFLKERGDIQKMITIKKAKVDEKNKNRPIKIELKKDWAPDFHEMLTYISHNDIIVSDPLTRTALRTILSKDTNNPFLVELNHFTHNPDYIPTGDIITDIWERFGKLLFKIILFHEDSEPK